MRHDKTKVPKPAPVRVQPDGWAARLQELKHRQTEDRLRRCDEMLTAAGVPEWVMNSENDGVPANSTPARLRWYLARRKDINPREVDQELQREMRKWLDYVAQHNTVYTPSDSYNEKPTREKH